MDSDPGNVGYSDVHNFDLVLVLLALVVRVHSSGGETSFTVERISDLRRTEDGNKQDEHIRAVIKTAQMIHRYTVIRHLSRGRTVPRIAEQ